MTRLPPPLDVSRPPHLHPRVVPWQHAMAWYEDAMRLFKRGPATWAGLAVITIAAEFLLRAVPGAGPVLTEALVPLVACGLIYAAAAADGAAAPSLRHAVMAFRAPASALFAVIASALVTFAAEVFAAWWIADANLLDAAGLAAGLPPATLLGIYTIGILASLPIMFVPFLALLEHAPPTAAFAASWNAFVLNTMPLLVYAAASLVLLGFVLATMGLGLVVALPLWAASSYAAWKDIFGVRDVPAG